MASDDNERTVFGQKIPPQAPRQPQPPVQPQAQAQPPVQGQQPPPAAPPGGGERTIFGVKVPGAAPPPQPQPPYPAPPPQQPYAPPPGQGGYPPQAAPPSPAQPVPGREDTWLGGAITPTQGAPVAPPQQPYPPQQPAYAPPPPQPYPPQQGYPQGYPPAQPAPGYPPQQPYAPPPGQGGYVGAPTPQDMQFPGAAPQQAPAPAAAVQKIAFQDALRGAGLEVGNATNPIIAAASDILILLGRLRTGMVEMQAIPLRDHVLRAVAEFTDKCQRAAIPPEDIDIARYALAATADDIVQTVPGNDPAYWQQFSMAAELLGDRSAGIGFFTRLEQVMAYAQQRRHVLELMLTCLSLGFEGRYRAEPNGSVTLSRIRAEVYQRFRSTTERPVEDLSHKWLPIILGGRRKQGAMPLWIVGSVAAGMVVALFASLSYLLSTEARAASDEIIAIHAGLVDVAIEGGEVEPAAVYEAPPTGQLERLQGRLSQEIEAGLTSVQEDGDYISIRLGDALRFGSGSAELQSDVSLLMQRIGEALEEEPGDIIVEGHSDNIPMSGAGRYKTNEALSEARAQTVSDLLAGQIGEPGRLDARGVGPAKPLDTANTPEARARNRRVEILVRKENRL
ncbi:MAG: type IVB secretion system protein IcmH/DotU [Pseudomonadota bacterium]